MVIFHSYVSLTTENQDKTWLIKKNVFQLTRVFSDELRPPNPGQSQEFDDLESWNSSLVRWQTVATFTLWLFNIAIENGPFIYGLPIKNGDFPWLCQITRWWVTLSNSHILHQLA